MPEISRFYGIIITMNFGDHNPPHFHVRHGEKKAVIDIRTGALLEGNLSPRAFGMVAEWARLHQVELLENWALAVKRAPVKKIAPLE